MTVLAMCQNSVLAHRFFCSYRSKIDDRRPTFPEGKSVGLSTVKCVAIRTFNVEPLRGSGGAGQREAFQVWGVAESRKVGLFHGIAADKAPIVSSGCTNEHFCNLEDNLGFAALFPLFALFSPFRSFRGRAQKEWRCGRETGAPPLWGCMFKTGISLCRGLS